MYPKKYCKGVEQLLEDGKVITHYSFAKVCNVSHVTARKWLTRFVIDGHLIQRKVLDYNFTGFSYKVIYLLPKVTS